MFDQLQILSLQLGIPAETLLMIGVGTGVLIIFFGIAAAFAPRNAAAVRMAAVNADRRQNRQDRSLLRGPTSDPRGIMKSFVPTDLVTRTRLQRELAQAGFSGPRAVSIFMMVRIVLGLVLPGVLVLLIVASKTPGIVLPFGLSGWISGFTNWQIFQWISILVAAGYFLPLKWLQGRVAERHLKIQEGFPNALDLMQISVEAGMGFDAAMTRVGNELAEVSPEIAFEFLSVQRQIQAGRAREAALKDMATRTGVETVRSFVNVVNQSIEFGTSMSEALTAYAVEMRLYREMQAQEMANKLPVKMSAVLASLMLPAIILLTVGPVVIRYMRHFAA